MTRHNCWFLFRLVLAWTVSAGSVALPDEPKPFFNARAHRTRYTEPVEQPLTPANVTEVRIGYFGPFDASDPDYGPSWLAAQQAVTIANREGGFFGKPFRLVPAWSKNPWGTGVKDLARLVYQQHVWAIVGGIDGPSTHLAEQVVAKARLPLVSPLCTDKTVNLANVPWMFSIAPGDHLIAPVLGRAIVQYAAGEQLVLVSANDHDSHLFTVELCKTLSQLGALPRNQFEFSAGDTHFSPLVRQCLAARPTGVIVVASAATSAEIVMQLRASGFPGRVFGGPTMGRARFRTLAGKHAQNVILPALVAWRSDDRYGELSLEAGRSKTPQVRQTATVDYTVVQTYDAVRLVTEAIRRAGLNRAMIGRELRGLAPHQGVSGEIRWDGLGANTRAPVLATIRDGQLVPLLLPESPLGILPH